MCSIKTTVSIIALLSVSSHELKTTSTDGTCLIRSVNSSHCSNDTRTYPTWFVCNSGSRCRYDKTTDKIVCDDEAQILTVLNCNCVTYYDSKSKFTYVGSCFYNCDSSKHTLPKNPEILINNSACTPFH